MIDEKFTSGKSFIHCLHPTTRIWAAILLSFATAFSHHFYPILGYGLVSAMLVFAARLPVRHVLARLKVLMWFLLMIWILVPLTFEGDTLYRFYKLTVSKQSILLCLGITLKSVTILMLFIALIATMRITALGNGLQRIRVPDKFVFLLLMSYRYIFLMQKEYHRLLRAARFRGFKPGTNLHSYKTFSYLAGMLFVRASLRAQNVHKAMLCRGFKTKFHTLDIYPPHRRNALFLIGILLISSVLIWTEIRI